MFLTKSRYFGFWTISSADPVSMSIFSLVLSALGFSRISINMFIASILSSKLISLLPMSSSNVSKIRASKYPTIIGPRIFSSTRGIVKANDLDTDCNAPLQYSMLSCRISPVLLLTAPYSDGMFTF